MQPHWRQPTGLPHPWDSLGKNTGVGCHFLLQCMTVKSQSEVAQSCPTLSDPVDCSLPGSSVHGIFQARVLEWGAIAFSYRIPNGSSKSVGGSHAPTSSTKMHSLCLRHASTTRGCLYCTTRVKPGANERWASLPATRPKPRGSAPRLQDCHPQPLPPVAPTSAPAAAGTSDSKY